MYGLIHTGCGALAHFAPHLGAKTEWSTDTPTLLLMHQVPIPSTHRRRWFQLIKQRAFALVSLGYEICGWQSRVFFIFTCATPWGKRTEPKLGSKSRSISISRSRSKLRLRSRLRLRLILRLRLRLNPAEQAGVIHIKFTHFTINFFYNFLHDDAAMELNGFYAKMCSWMNRNKKLWSDEKVP